MVMYANEFKTKEKQKLTEITLLRHCFEWWQHCFKVATLCCAKNRRCESFRVESP